MATARRYTDIDHSLCWRSALLTLTPLTKRKRKYLSLLLRDRGRLVDSLSASEEAEALDPTDPIAKFYSAILRWRLDDSDRAAFDMRTAMAQLPSLESTGRIKQLWSTVIPLEGYAYMSDPEGLECVALAEQLSEVAQTPRDQLAVIGHVLFTVSLDPQMIPSQHPCLMPFDPEVVRIAVERSHGRSHEN